MSNPIEELAMKYDMIASSSSLDNLLFPRNSSLVPLKAKDIINLNKTQIKIAKIVKERMRAIWEDDSPTRQSLFIRERLKDGYQLVGKALSIINEFCNSDNNDKAEKKPFDWDKINQIGRKILFEHASALATANRKLGNLYELPEVDRVAYKLEAGKLLASYLTTLSMAAMINGDFGGTPNDIKKIFKDEKTESQTLPKETFSNLFSVFGKMQNEVFKDQDLTSNPSLIFARIEKFFQDKPQLAEIVKDIVSLGRVVKPGGKAINRYGDPESRATAQYIFWNNFFASYMSDEFQSLLTPFGRLLGPIKQKLASIISNEYLKQPGIIFDIGTGITKRSRGETQMAVPGDVLKKISQENPGVTDQYYKNLFLTDISGGNLDVLAEEVLPRGGRLGYWDATHPTSFNFSPRYVIASLSLHQLDRAQQKEAYHQILTSLQENGMFFTIGVSKETGWLQSLVIPHNLIDEEGYDLIPPGLIEGREEMPLDWISMSGKKDGIEGYYCLVPVPNLCKVDDIIYDLVVYKKVFLTIEQYKVIESGKIKWDQY